MTHDEARSLLKKYYCILELANDYKLRSTDIIIAVGQKTHSTTSLQEREVVRRVSLLQDIQSTADVISRLHEDYQKFIGLRFGREMSLRAISREMFTSKDTVWRLEGESLRAFIRIYDQDKKETTVS